jgi:ubiquinone/menaquinone biosynthesis C-methylase UbiE
MTGIANQAAFEAWNGESGRRWALDPDRRDEFAGPVGDALLVAAGLRPGDDVLDVGCGCGATTLAAAVAVGATGTAHGVDLSEPMLDVARHRLAASTLTHVAFTRADAQAHHFDPAHDVLISRFGTMFFDDPVAAFANLATSLRPGGRLCIATWQPLGANLWLTVPGAALLRYGTFPDTRGIAPGMFAQSDPDVIRSTLERAGYRNVDVEQVAVTLRLGDDPQDATEHLAQMGTGRAILATIAEADRAEALAAVAATLQEHWSAEGVRLPAGILVTTARLASARPSAPGPL